MQKHLLISVLKVSLSIVAIGLFSLGTIWCFTPNILLNIYGISSKTVTGINMLKSDMGGAVIIVASFIFLYLIKGKYWLKPAIISVAIILFNRIISSIVDGVTPLIWIAIGLESIALVVMVFLFNQDSD